MTSGSKPVLILGAGINGCALARELVLNGVPVTIVDRADIACGATAGSSRLIHGGLRYLEFGELDLVKESLAERTRLLRLAPQFVRPLRLWIPASNRFGGMLPAIGRYFGWSWWPWPVPKAGRGVSLIRAGLAMYDAYARDKELPKHQVFAASAPGAPPFNLQKYRWLCAYYDAQVAFPERLVLALLEDARQLAAEKGLAFHVLNYHEARLRDESVDLYAVHDGVAAATSAVEPLRPAMIVNATGAWVDDTLKRLHLESQRLMGGTKGSHLFTFNERLRDSLAGQGIYAEAADGRPIFITPLAGTTLIGTTDVPIDSPPEDAFTTDRERDYLLDAVNEILPEVRLTAADVDFHTSAVRPLPFVPAAAPAAITRRHSLVHNNRGPIPLLSVIGGKLTTMRALAELAAAAVLDQIGRQPTANSEDRPIPGADHYPRDRAAREADWNAIAARVALPPAAVAAVWQLCGTRAAAILAAGSERELLPETDLPVAFARWSIRHEFAATLADLVERRLMLLYHQRLTRACLERLAQLLVEERKLPAAEVVRAVDAEVAHLRRRYGKYVA